MKSTVYEAKPPEAETTMQYFYHALLTENEED